MGMVVVGIFDHLSRPSDSVEAIVTVTHVYFAVKLNTYDESKE